MADTATVGILKTMLTMDTSSYDSGAKKAAQGAESVKKSVAGLGEEVKKITPLADRMVKSFGGDKLLYTANSLTSAVTKLGGAQKLTEAEQAKVNRTLDAAIQKYKQLGQDAPKAMVDLERATRRTDGPLQTLNSNLKSSIGLTAGIGAALGAFAAQLAGQAIRGVITMGREAFETASRTADLSASLGISTEAIQRMDFVAGQVGATLEDMTGAAFKLGVRLAGGGDSVANAVGKLGLNLQALQRMTPEKQFEAVVTALGHMQDATQRNEIGVALFGKSFQSIAAAVSADYQELARQARVSSDAQIQALDRAGDAWDRFKKNTHSTVRSVLGDIVLIAEELNKSGFRDWVNFLASAVGPTGIAGSRVVGRTQIPRREGDVRLAPEMSGAPPEDFVQKLKAVEAELSKLTAEQRAQIDAARKLGGDALKQLEDQYGLTEGALSIYTEGMKKAETASKNLAKSQKELAKEAEDANRRWLDILGSIESSQLKQESEFRKLERGDGLPHLFPGDAALNTEEASLAALKKDLDARDKAAAEWRQFQNFVGERAMEDEAAILERRKRNWQEFQQFIQGIFQPLVSGVTDAIGSLIFGTGQSKPKRGTLSAEEYTRAMREFEGRWDAFWHRLGKSAMDVLKNILGMFVNSFIGGMVKALVGSGLGQAFGNWLAKGLGIATGGGSNGLLGAGASAAVGALGIGGGTALASTAAVPTTAALLGPAPAGAAAAAGGGGVGAAIAGFATNPITIGVAAAIGGAFLLKKLGLFDNGPGDFSRSIAGRLMVRHGRSLAQLPDWIRGDASTMQKLSAGFAAPNTGLPASLNVGASVPMVDAQSAGRAVVVNQQITIPISAVDQKGVREFFRSREATDSISRAFEDNANSLASRVSRALAR